MIDAGIKRFGSGWSWLVWDGTGLAVLSTPNQDSPVMEGKTPLFGIDVWEHAYYLKYQNRRPEYLEAIWNVVDWDAVGARFEARAASGARAPGRSLGPERPPAPTIPLRHDSARTPTVRCQSTRPSMRSPGMGAVLPVRLPARLEQRRSRREHARGHRRHADRARRGTASERRSRSSTAATPGPCSGSPSAASATAAAPRTPCRRSSPPCGAPRRATTAARGPGGAWLYTIARNAIVDAQRREPPPTVADPPEIVSTEPDARRGGRGLVERVAGPSCARDAARAASEP